MNLKPLADFTAEGSEEGEECYSDWFELEIGVCFVIGGEKAIGSMERDRLYIEGLFSSSTGVGIGTDIGFSFIRGLGEITICF